MKKVILNVGHGGVKRDPGACGNGFEEHAWNKDFVNNYIVPECKEQGVDYVVVYQDYYSKLPDKINNLANKDGRIFPYSRLLSGAQPCSSAPYAYGRNRLERPNDRH